MPIKFFPMLPFSAQWGQISGNINEQSDLVDELENKADAEHNHNAIYEPKNVNIQEHIASEDNPHKITKEQIGLSKFSQESTSRTVVIPQIYSTEQIQAEIDAIGKYIPNGVTITIQFTNTSAKYLNNSAVVDLGDGTVKISCTNHGFVQGDVVSIDGTTNYNGEYTLPSQANGDANNFVITATYVAETPPTTAIVRKPLNLTTALQLKGFYGGGTIIIQGNIGETDGNGFHTTQQVYLKSNSNTNVLSIINNQVQFMIKNIKVKANTSSSSNSAVYASVSDVSIYFSYFLGTSASYGFGINIINSGATAYIQKNYVSNVLYGIGSQLTALVYSNENDDYGTMPAYGLLSSSAIIYKRSTQPAGSTANESKANGGQIF